MGKGVNASIRQRHINVHVAQDDVARHPRIRLAAHLFSGLLRPHVARDHDASRGAGRAVAPQPIQSAPTSTMVGHVWQGSRKPQAPTANGQLRAQSFCTSWRNTCHPKRWLAQSLQILTTAFHTAGGSGLQMPVMHTCTPGIGTRLPAFLRDLSAGHVPFLTATVPTSAHGTVKYPPVRDYADLSSTLACPHPSPLAAAAWCCALACIGLPDLT